MWFRLILMTLLFIPSFAQAASQDVILSPLESEVEAVKVSVGQTVKKGDTLLTFKCSGFDVALKRAEKTAELLEQDYLRKLQLEDLGMESKKAVALARTRHETKEMKVENMKDLFRKCSLKAPETGTVKEILFNLPYKPLVDQPLMVLERHQ